MKLDIRNHSSMTGLESVAEKLYKFAQKQLGFDKPARVVFESHGDRAIDMFSPTGNYNPQTKTITIFVDHRHPKDILRSMAHELIHHAQCCMGAFDSPVDTSPGYAQKDDRMRDLERDAYFWGNGILFRDWEDNHKNKRSWDLMNENKRQITNEQKLRRKIRRLIRENLQEQTMAQQIAADDASQEAGELEGVRGHTPEHDDLEALRIMIQQGYDPMNPVTPTELPPEQIEEGGVVYQRDDEPDKRPTLRDLAIANLPPGEMTPGQRSKETFQRTVARHSPEELEDLLGPQHGPKGATMAQQGLRVDLGKKGGASKLEETAPMMEDEAETDTERTAEKMAAQTARRREERGLTGSTKATPVHFEEGKKPDHDCANHVKENRTGREGRAINHTLLEDGSITHYTVEFQNEIVENIPVNELTALTLNEHAGAAAHAMKRDDYAHDKSKPRMPFEEGEEVEEVSKPVKQSPESPPGYIVGGSTEHRRFDKEMAQRRAALEEEKPLKEWYNDTLHEALLKKFKIKK